MPNAIAVANIAEPETRNEMKLSAYCLLAPPRLVVVVVELGVLELAGGEVVEPDLV
jgi:hypothetical protein